MKTKAGYAFLIVIIVLVSYSHAALSSGLDTLFTGAFDFSSPDSVRQFDIRYTKQSAGIGEILTGAVGIAVTDDSVLADVAQAPDAGYDFIVDLTVDNKNRVFCVKTTENRRAKFRIMGYNQAKKIIIDWVYQNDTTFSFISNPVSKSYNAINWGRLKKTGLTK